MKKKKSRASDTARLIKIMRSRGIKADRNQLRRVYRAVQSGPVRCDE